MSGVENFQGISESGCVLSYLFCFGRNGKRLSRKKNKINRKGRIRPEKGANMAQTQNKGNCRIRHKRKPKKLPDTA